MKRSSETFEKVLASMSDTEFDALLNSVRRFRNVSVPVEEYIEQTEHMLNFYSFENIDKLLGNGSQFCENDTTYNLAA